MKRIFRMVTEAASRKTSVTAPPAMCEPLEGRRLLSISIISPISNVTFAQDSGEEQANLNGVFADSNGQSDLTFSATSDNPGVVASSINGAVLTITPGNAASGFANIRMTATDPVGDRSVNAFRVQITAAANRSLDVTLDSAHRSVNFVQANHASATIALSGPGTAVLHFGGDGLKLAGGNLNGANQELESITLSGTTAGTALSIKGRIANRQEPSIGNITATGALGLLQITKAFQQGDITVSGAAPRVDIDTAEGGTITLASTALTITGKQFVDESLIASSARAVNVKTRQWIDSDNVGETFSAVTIAHLSVPGSFDPGLQLSGGGRGLTLGPTNVRGTIGGQWNITGPSAPLKIGGTISDWNAAFTSLPGITVTGTGTLTGTLTVPSLSYLKVGGNLFLATINLTATGRTDLAQLKAKVLDAATINAAGNIGTISATGLQFATIFAGVGSVPSGDVLPASASDFSAVASIGAVVLHPTKKTGFFSSDIAASHLGTLSLGVTQTNNSGFKFGIAASSIGALTAVDKTRHQTIEIRNVHDAATLAAQIAAEKLQLGDMVIRII